MQRDGSISQDEEDQEVWMVVICHCKFKLDIATFSQINFELITCDYFLTLDLEVRPIVHPVHHILML